jgi:putative ABC transport system permease protein
VTGAWRLATRNLRRHRRRNAVTALAVALGYAGIVVLFGYAGWEERILRVAAVYVQHRGHLAVYAPGGLKRAEAKPSRFALPVEAQEAIGAALRADPRVEHVGRYLLGSGIAGNGCRSFQMRAVGLEPALERQLMADPEVVALMGPESARVEGRSIFDVAEDDAPVSLAPILAQSLEKHRIAVRRPRPPPAIRLAAAQPVALGTVPVAEPDAAPPAPLDCAAPDVQAHLGADPFVQLGARTIDGHFGAVEGRAVGVFHPASTEESKTALLAPIELLQRLYDTDRVTYVAAYLRNHRDAPAVERDLVARLHAAGLEVNVHRFDDGIANPYFAGNMTFLYAMVAFIVVLVINVVAFSVVNAMTIAAIERAREMGTLRALGFTRGELTGIFLREAALLTAVAVGIGAALAATARILVAAAGVRFMPPGGGTEVVLQLLPPPLAWIATAACFLFLTVSATWVAVRARARTNVSELIAEVAA